MTRLAANLRRMIARPALQEAFAAILAMGLAASGHWLGAVLVGLRLLWMRPEG